MSLELDEAAFAARFKQTPDGWVDSEDGARVLVHELKPGRYGFEHVGPYGSVFTTEYWETTARIAAALELPWVVRVRCVLPRVVTDAPPVSEPHGPLRRQDAVECLLQLCEVMAHAHAAGWAGLFITPGDIQVTRADDGARRIAVLLLPGLAMLDRRSHLERTVPHDLRLAVGFLRNLLLGHGIPKPPVTWRKTRRHGSSTITWRVQIMVALMDFWWALFGTGQIREVLVRMLVGRSQEGTPRDAAGLAELVLPLARDPERWKARIAALPRVPQVKVRFDLDRLIELGEARVKANADAFPFEHWLGTTYHLRASRAWAAGDLEGASRDTEAAIEHADFQQDLLDARVTRAFLLGVRGDWAATVRECSEVLAKLQSKHVWDWNVQGWQRDYWTGYWGSERTGLRALYIRGVAHWRTGNVSASLTDLEEASKLAAQIAANALEHHDWVPVLISGTPLTELENKIRRALLPVYRVLLRETPGDHDLRLRRAENLLALGRRDEARAEGLLAAAHAGDDAWRARLDVVLKG